MGKIEDRSYMFNIDECSISEETSAFLKKIAAAGAAMGLEPIKVTIPSENELKDNFGFTLDECQKLKAIVEKKERPSTQEKFSFSNYTIYISHSDLTAGVFAVVGAAASVGPAALAAAIEAVSAAIGGFAGAFLGLVIDIVGAAALASLAATIVTAIATGKGIYISIKPGSNFLSFGLY